jgi:hypothetical protein
MLVEENASFKTFSLHKMSRATLPRGNIKTLNNVTVTMINKKQVNINKTG